LLVTQTKKVQNRNPSWNYSAAQVGLSRENGNQSVPKSMNRSLWILKITTNISLCTVRGLIHPCLMVPGSHLGIMYLQVN